MKFFAVSLLALVSALSVRGVVVTKTVTYQHEGVNLQGYVAYDDVLVRGKKVPGVLVVPEWWGVNEYVKSRARQLAQLGLVAFVADMYGDGMVTTDAKKAGELAGKFYGKPLMAQRAQAGLNQLLTLAGVDPLRVAAIGYCFGGSTVQALAYSGANLSGIVSFHGGIIPVPDDVSGKLKAKILMCSGAIDPMVPTKDVEKFKKAMDDGKFDYVFIEYANAKHAFTNPEATVMGQQNKMDAIAYNEKADHRSWAHMQDFFHEIFASK